MNKPCGFRLCRFAEYSLNALADLDSTSNDLNSLKPQKTVRK